MKIPRPFLFLVATIVPALLIVSNGCSKSDTSSATTAAQDAKTAITNAAVDVKNAAVDTWDSVRDYTYDKRMEFSASIDRMDKNMDDKIAEEKTKAPDTLSKEKQAAIKDYDDARADLKARLADLGNATADTWADAKAKVSEAWQRVKADYDKATS
jgi:gas vesicle protein